MPPRPPSPVVRIALVASLVLLVVGIRWTAVARWGTDLPIWDQWDSEGRTVLIPWDHHELSLAMLAAPHNEHRSILTKLVNLSLTLADGQWDQRLECAVNALLPAIIAAALLLIACRHFTGLCLAAVFAVVAAAYAVPVGWQNVVGGWHSAQFMLVGLSLGAIAWLPESHPFERDWWIGAAFATLALATMASGFFAAVVVFGMLVVRIWQRKITVRDAAPSIFLCAALGVVGWLIKAPVEGHLYLMAKSARAFAVTAGYSLLWPMLIDMPLAVAACLAAVFWAPWCWLSLRVLRGRTSGENGGKLGWLLAGSGGWVLLQILAAAYSRGENGVQPAPRYIDTLAFGSVINALAAAWLWKYGSSGRAARMAATLLGCVWIAAFATGFTGQAKLVMGQVLPGVGASYKNVEINVRQYLATGDISALRRPDKAYPDPNVLAKFLSEPALRNRMPVSVRPDGKTTALSRLALKAVRTGPVLAMAGASIALLLAVAAIVGCNRAHPIFQALVSAPGSAWRASRAGVALLLCGIAIAIVGAKRDLINRCGTELLDVPSIRAALALSAHPPCPIVPDASSTQAIVPYRDGLPAGKPPPGLAVWITPARTPADPPARFLSRPFPVDHELVSLFVAAIPPSTRIGLRTIDKDGIPHAPMDLDLSYGPHWKRVNFLMPKGPAQFEATVSGEGWFAFTQPTTNTRLARFVEKFVVHGPFIVALGAAMALLGTLLLVRKPRTERP